MPDTNIATIPPILAKLHPKFAVRVQQIMDKVQAGGKVPWIVSGLRTPEEQAKIYSVGRGTPGQSYTVAGITVTAPARSEYPSWGIISKAPPFTSAHQWGLAVDFGWIINGKKVLDTSDKSYWQMLYNIAQTENAEDIVKAVPFDRAHIQSKAWHTVKANLEDYKRTYLESGMAAIYTRLSGEAVI